MTPLNPRRHLRKRENLRKEKKKVREPNGGSSSSHQIEEKTMPDLISLTKRECVSDRGGQRKNTRRGKGAGGGPLAFIFTRGGLKKLQVWGGLEKKMKKKPFNT